MVDDEHEQGQVDEQLVSALMAVARGLVGLTSQSLAAAPIDVTIIQYRALVLLAERTPRPISELAGLLGLSPSSATRLLERLERKEFARRAPSPESRRKVDIHLEPAGEELVRIVMAERRRQLQRLLGGIAPSRMAATRRAFTDLAALLGESIDVPVPVSGTP